MPMPKMVTQDWFGPLSKATTDRLLDELAERLGNPGSRLRRELAADMMNGTDASGAGWTLLARAEAILEYWQENDSEQDAMDAARYEREGA